jgi:hypothetical protein
MGVIRGLRVREGRGGKGLEKLRGKEGDSWAEVLIC